MGRGERKSLNAPRAGGHRFQGGGQLWVWTTVLGILPTRYSCSPTAHKMDTSPGGPSQQPGPTPAALVLLGPIRRHATGRRVEACRLLCANAACAAACVCCQTRGGAGPFGDRTRQSYSPGGRYGLEQHPGRGCCSTLEGKKNCFRRKTSTHILPPPFSPPWRGAPLPQLSVSRTARGYRGPRLRAGGSLPCREA